MKGLIDERLDADRGGIIFVEFICKACCLCQPFLVIKDHKEMNYGANLNEFDLLKNE
jgi:hypothetical protein